MTISTPTTDCIATDRSGITENRHFVHAAITDSTGRLLLAVGDPHRVTLLRSAAKPAQGVAILETGCFERFPGLDDRDLALVCASHSSESVHVGRASGMLKIIDAGEGDLACGGHPSISEVVNRGWIRADYVPSAIDNNCSGKHAGMLAGCRALGTELQGYHSPDHLMQVRVKNLVEELSGLEGDEVRWGIDGCNLPAPAMPLHNMARVYAVVAGAADSVSKSEESGPKILSSSSSRTQALSRVFHAMSSYPELVGGHGRFCTELMRAFKGALIGKVGADGCYGVGVRASEATKRLGAVGAIGIAVKIEDGNLAVLYSAVAEILERMKIGSEEIIGALKAFHRPEISNTAGVVTGGYSHMFEVRGLV
ncbi:asparaginase [Aspergillus stella-maris]|uniref:asparaginase n=1 Tax=Aspergillus stella-maris TaxID=1810926 RepID=UPI003CCD3628